MYIVRNERCIALTWIWRVRAENADTIAHTSMGKRLLEEGMKSIGCVLKLFSKQYLSLEMLFY